MRLLSVFLLAVTLVIPVAQAQSAGGFELPVQLIGFPVIIVAVRIANFLKKLSYALSPRTYVSRPRRGAQIGLTLDPAEVEKRLVKEMGEGVCIYEDICIKHANPTMRSEQIDWEQLFKHYGRRPNSDGDHYLLSVFMGDIIGSPTLCKQLAKRGRSCYNTRTNNNWPTSTFLPTISSDVSNSYHQLNPPMYYSSGRIPPSFS